MFQDFDTPADSGDALQRVKRLRGELARLGLDAFLVPRADSDRFT